MQHERRSFGQQVRQGFAPLPQPHVRLHRPVPHRDDVPRPHEHVRFAELDPVLAAAGEPGRAEHHEQRIFVHLQLGTLMGIVGVLDRQLVQPKRLFDGFEQLLAGLEQAHPEEAVGVPPGVAQIGHRHVGHALAVVVGGGVDHAVARGLAGGIEGFEHTTNTGDDYEFKASRRKRCRYGCKT